MEYLLWCIQEILEVSQYFIDIFWCRGQLLYSQTKMGVVCLEGLLFGKTGRG